MNTYIQGFRVTTIILGICFIIIVIVGYFYSPWDSVFEDYLMESEEIYSVPLFKFLFWDLLLCGVIDTMMVVLYPMSAYYMSEITHIISFFGSIIISCFIFFAVRVINKQIYSYYENEFDDLLFDWIDLYFIDNILGYLSALLTFSLITGWDRLMSSFNKINIVFIILFLLIMLVALGIILGIYFYFLIYILLITIPVLIIGLIVEKFPESVEMIFFIVGVIPIEYLIIYRLWPKISEPLLRVSVWIMKFPLVCVKKMFEI